MRMRFVVVGASVALGMGLWAGAIALAAFTWRVSAELEGAVALAELTPRPQTTIVYDRHGHPAFSFFVERRTDVPLDQVSPMMIEALLAVEDQRFFRHKGLDPIRIAGAALKNLTAGRVREGGSTITQQLARASQLTRERTFERKLREAMVAARLEQRYSKREILEAYLNTVYFGEGYYGVEAAAQGYFGKSAADLDAAEAALLAAIVRSPSLDAPRVSPERARKRRDLVLRLMRAQERIGEPELRAALASAIPYRSTDKTVHADRAGEPRDGGEYFEEELRRQLVAHFGSDRVLRGGLRVYSTYDPALQKAAEDAIAARVAALGKRARSARDLQGALVAMDPRTGDVHALVGGRSFAASSFNRATQARRQAGSAFKPIVVAAALERGYSPATVLTGLDSAIANGTETWLPGGEHESEAFSIRAALKVSSNRAAAQLLQQVGLSTATYYARRLGIVSPLPMVPSLALGTGEVTLLELTTAYTAFANRGITSSPRLFTRVDDANGVTLLYGEERHTPAVTEATAYLMSSMLQDVVNAGTATGVRAAGFRLPAAGKTGTSDDYADAWFVGYTPTLVTGVWFGLDKPAPIMARGYGGVVAVPAWASFMREATRGQKAKWFEMPAAVERVAICRRSGARAVDACRYELTVAAMPVGTAGFMNVAHQADDGSDDPPAPDVPPVYEDLFAVGAVPSEICPIHGAAAGTMARLPISR